MTSFKKARNSHKPLFDRECLLEKFPGKGGWTYAQIPEIHQNKENPFGWVKVKGSIDGFEIKKYHLMPMGQGRLFLPVKAAIRKIIRKSVGDKVHVVLYPDHDPLHIPEEFLLCLEDEPSALRFFNSLSETERKYYVDWVSSAQRIETRVKRLSETVNRLARGLKKYDQNR